MAPETPWMWGLGKGHVLATGDECGNNYPLTEITGCFAIKREPWWISMIDLCQADGCRQHWTEGHMPRGMGGGDRGVGGGTGGDGEQSKAAWVPFILNWAIHWYKSKLEPWAGPFSSIKALQSLQPGGRGAASYSCSAVNKISPGTKHFNLKRFYQEQLTNLSRKLAVWRGASIPVGKGL